MTVSKISITIVPFLVRGTVGLTADRPAVLEFLDGKMDSYPPVTVYGVCAEDEKTVWHETFATINEVRAFVRGFKAASAANGVWDVDIRNGTNEPV